MRTALPAWERWRGRPPSPAPLEPTLRQVLAALETGEKIQWARNGPTYPPADIAERRYRAPLLGGAALLLVLGAACLIDAYAPPGGEERLLAAMPSPRLQQIAGTVWRPMGMAAAAAESDALPPDLVAPHAVELKSGQRTRLAVHIANAGSIKPESIALITGLPEDVRLTDGIMIGPGLWMLRPALLMSVEFEAAQSARGDYALQLELRTPSGAVVSSAHMQLVITAAPAQTEVQTSVSRSTAATQLSEGADKAATTEALAPPKRKPSVAREAGGPTARDRGPAKREARAKVRIAKPPRRRAAHSESANLATGQAVQQTFQPQRLVWPGDDPRSAPYLMNPPVFLGGSVPDVESRPRR